MGRPLRGKTDGVANARQEEYVICHHAWQVEFTGACENGGVLEWANNLDTKDNRL